MAKKKKQSKNTKKKYSGPKQVYTVRSLKEIIHATEQKLENNEAVSTFDEKLCKAASQALSLIKLATENGFKLDLSRDSEYYLMAALMTLGVNKQDEGTEEEQIIQELSETGASYLLFEQINMLRTFGVIGEVHYDPDQSANVIIKAHTIMKSKNVLFDTYDAMNRVSSECFIFKDVAPERMGIKDADPGEVVRGLAVNLDPYSLLVQNELLYQL